MRNSEYGTELNSPVACRCIDLLSRATMAHVGGEMWRKNALYEIMDGKTSSLVGRLQQDPE